MKIGYQGFTFSIPMMGIIQIEEFVLRAELNDHAHVYFKLLVEEAVCENETGNTIV